MNPTLMLIAAGAGLASSLLAVALVRALAGPQASVQQRLAAIGAASPYQQQRQSGTATVIRDRRDSSIPVLNRLLNRRESTARARLALERAGLPLRVGEYVGIRLIAVMLGAAIGYFVGGTVGGAMASWLGLAIAASIATFAVPWYVRRRISRRKASIEFQLVEFCDLVASMLESGFGYMQALHSTANQIGPPLSVELLQILDAVRLGGDVDQALEELNVRLASQDFDMVVTGISIQRRSGGNLAEILRQVAQTIRERHSFRREVSALTSAARFSALLMVLLPIILAVALSAIMPDTFAVLFTEPAGRLILAGAAVLDGIGYAVMQRVVKLEI